MPLRQNNEREKMNNDIKILVCCHKQCDLPNNDIYLPIHVGKSESKIDLGIQSDCDINGNRCENISNLNAFYCEMTGMYWAWKNIRSLYSEVEYVGLCHYRRYFKANRNINRNEEIKKTLGAIKDIITGRNQKIRVVDNSKVVNGLGDIPFCDEEQELRKVIKNNDMLYTQPVRIVNASVRNFFSILNQSYIQLLENIIKNENDEYYEDMVNILNGSKLTAANMIILKIDYLDSYCEFIFETLKRFSEVLEEKKYMIHPFEERVFDRVPGYMSELLTATYISHMIRTSLRCQELGKYFIMK